MHPEVNMLAAVVVLFMASGMSDALNVTKCSLKQQLETSLGLTANTTNLLSKIVCHVSLTSNFSTSAINEVYDTKEAHNVQIIQERRKLKVEHKKTVLWTMYGLFQLSDHVVCASAHSHKPNLCKLSCQNLLNDDLTDDLACIKLLITKVFHHHETVADIQELLLFFDPRCASVTDATYFPGCPQ
ncbi:alpha-lactalbumin-like [Danio aesculapii]|uniref:alpha-lactalbumin-like n=1 Tax=Danio aesculapii TaxID=1142201 RepID=UPI0024C08F81|nr:alpha-lactalbumin-like [Danio aesculapii]